MRNRKDYTTNGIITQDLDEEPEKNYTEHRVQQMPSKLSIPKIGPFISG